MTKVMLYGGGMMDVMDPDPSLITVDVITHHLSMQARYNGASRKFYSVAEHSVFCATVAHNVYRDDNLTRACLLHDAHEAFIGDIITPMKSLLVDSPWWHAADALDLAIQERFGVCFDDPRIKTIDEHMLACEWQQLMPEPDRYAHLKLDYALPDRVECFTPGYAKELFKIATTKWSVS